MENAESRSVTDRDSVRRRSLRHFVLLEFALSIPFWGIGALAQAHVIPDQVMFRAAWSLTPMMAASILVFRASRAAGVKEFLKRILDYSRIKSRIWLLAVLLTGPLIVFAQYGLALLAGQQVPPPQLTLAAPLALLGFFLITWTEELGWTAYALDTLLQRGSALIAGIGAGIMWASLHAPVWLLAGESLEWCAWQWLYVVALRVLMTWIYSNTGRSLFAMDLLHPGFFVWWYLWPVSGTGLSMPAVYDPRSLALIALTLAAIVTYLWGPDTLTRFRFSRKPASVAVASASSEMSWR
jgi:membrane protease YdiL (CAAX protease family)